MPGRFVQIAGEVKVKISGIALSEKRNVYLGFYVSFKMSKNMQEPGGLAPWDPMDYIFNSSC